MKAFFKLFQSEADRMMSPQYYFDCRSSPNRLLSQLKHNSEMKKIIKAIQSPSVNPFKYIRILSICNLLLIYGKDWFGFIEENLRLKITHDEWLNTKFIEPYHRFLIKCCAAKDQYIDSKNTYPRKGQALEALFYSINMLKQLFKIVQKMPFLGRYYKTAHNEVVSTAIQVLALQAQKLYSYFKSALTQILFRRELYIQNRDDQCIMRGVLSEQLITINEEMKKLFLDKYFYPLGKGIGVKLFRPEEQSPQFQKVIQSIVTDHQNTERARKHDQLQKTLFPGSGLVNWNFYEETLLSGPLNNTCRADESTYKELDDIVLSQEDEEEEQDKVPKKVEVDKIFTKDKQLPSQKQTNTGTIQIKGDEL